MRGIKVLLIAAIALPATMLVATAAQAGVAEPTSAKCSDSALAAVQGVYVPSQAKCSTGVVQCPVNSAGCSFGASIEMTAVTGVGASRGQLRLKDPDTGQTTDFFCGGPATHCGPLFVTSFLPAGQRLIATCSVTKDNVLVRPTVKCSAAFQPLGE